MSTSAGRCQQSPPHPYRTLLRLLPLPLPLPRRPPPQPHRPNPTLPPRPRRLRPQRSLCSLQNRSDPQRRVRRTDRRSSTTACRQYTVDVALQISLAPLLWTHLYQYSCFSYDREGLMVTRNVSVPVYLMRRTPCARVCRALRTGSRCTLTDAGLRWKPQVSSTASERPSDLRGPGSRENRRTVQPWTLVVLHFYYYPSLSTWTCMNECSTNTKPVVFMR